MVHFQQLVVLGMEAVIDDLSAFSQRVSPGVHQRLVFQMFVTLAQHGVDRQQPARQPAAALVHQVVGMLQKLAGGRDSVVFDRLMCPGVVSVLNTDIDIALACAPESSLHFTSLLFIEKDCHQLSESLAQESMHITSTIGPPSSA